MLHFLIQLLHIKACLDENRVVRKGTFTRVSNNVRDVDAFLVLTNFTFILTLT